MADVEERRFGDLTIRIDRLLCVGFEDCIDHAADVFELDDEGIAVFLEGAGEDAEGGADGLRRRLLSACESCPVDALVALNGDGTQVAP